MRDFFRGQTVLVTGASSGIGREMATDLGARGARVLLVARSEGALHTVADEVRQEGGEAAVFVHDLEPGGASEALVDAVEAAGETVDVLVNNAGFGIQGPLLEHDAAQAEAMVGLNALAVTGLTARLVPGMVARGRGGVLTVASVAAFVPAPRFAVYAATKAYALRFSEALHAELKRTGVHVSCLCPGPVRTRFAERAGMDDAFFDGALAADRVAREGLDGLARNRRVVVPGVLNKVQRVLTRLVPTAPTMAVTEAVMRRAG